MADEIVELNVGGQLFTTTRTTLTKFPDSTVAAMFSLRLAILRDKNGRYFLDCDGGVFKYILEYLRFGSLPPCQHFNKVKEYAIMFELHTLAFPIEAQVVELNVRGQHFTISRDTLQELTSDFPNLNSILSDHNDLPRDSAGRCFVDESNFEFEQALYKVYEKNPDNDSQSFSDW